MEPPKLSHHLGLARGFICKKRYYLYLTTDNSRLWDLSGHTAYVAVYATISRGAECFLLCALLNTNSLEFVENSEIAKLHPTN